jgi:hypothetical protein
MLDLRLEDFDADDRFVVDDSASRLLGTGVLILVSADRSAFFSCDDGRAAATGVATGAGEGTGAALTNLHRGTWHIKLGRPLTYGTDGPTLAGGGGTAAAFELAVITSLATFLGSCLPFTPLLLLLLGVVAASGATARSCLPLAPGR